MAKTPSPGAGGSGAGKDSPGAAKDRAEFERQRRERMRGGKDRPPSYKPKDDGNRDGYKNRTIPAQPRVKAELVAKMVAARNIA